MDPADIIKDAVALIKEYAQELKKSTEMMLNPGN